MNFIPGAPAQCGFRGLIGVARRDITPPVGIFAKSWGAATHETVEGIHRPLILTCITFQSDRDGSPLVLIGADLGWWRSKDDEWNVRGPILKSAGLDPARLMICFSHTHAGPALQLENASRPGGHLIEPYQGKLRDAAISAIAEALDQRRESILTWRYGRCDLAGNRDLPEPSGGKRVIVGYNPSVPADDTLLVGRITDASGRPTGTIVNYACHPTTLAWDNRLISPDYVGAMRELVESHTDGTPCLYLQGASGELAPAEQYSGDTLLADRHGKRLGFAALSVLEAMDRPGEQLKYDRVVESGAALGVWKQFPCELRTDLAADEGAIEYQLKDSLPSIAEIEQQWRATSDPVMKERLWRKRGMRRCVGDGRTSRMPLWAWRLGDALLLGQPLEAYSRFQMRLREQFPGRAIAVMNVVNGSAGYLAPAELYDTDTYQIWQSPFARGSLERLIDQATQAAARLLAPVARTSSDAVPIHHHTTAERLGTATLEPSDPIVAGTTGEWTITLTVGSAGIDEGGTIKLAQRFASDWEASQFDRPTESGYTTVRTNGHASLRPRYDRKGHDRPWMHCIVIDVYDGSLAPGDVVKIVLGDRTHGSPGIRSQTFQESAHDFLVLVDPTNACVARPVAKSPTVPIIAGPPVELVCIVPTRSAEPEKHVFVKGQDHWGNPTPAPKDLDIARDGDTFTATSASTSLTARSNPTRTEKSKFNRYWGDLHAQSDATVGTGSEVEYFTFARDVARLDFCSHQGNDFQVTEQAWRRLNNVIRDFHREGSFVVFPGWEWSGNTSAGGDRNVWYLEEDLPMFRSSHWQVRGISETEISPADTAAELFEHVRKFIPPGKALLAAHVGGRYADIRKYFDPELGPLVEVVSCWGVFEWMIWDAFDCGYVIGIVCNSDGHKGRPGAEGPGAGQFGIANGLTCVLAEELTRQSIFSALQQRRCYGTTGARIDLDFEIDGQPMGSIIDTGKEAPRPIRVRADVRGTAPLESLALYRGRDVIETIRPPAFSSLGSSNRIRVSMRGCRIRGRGRRVRWDGTIRVDGARIVSAHSRFDTLIDGITRQSDHEIEFINQTTGDTDTIDLTLDRVTGDATITLDAKPGKCQIRLSELTDTSPRKDFPLGGIDISATIERYPADPTETTISLDATVNPPVGENTPYFVKVTQVDGQMAWSSPIYLFSLPR